ncbi:unnamed protein product, partial [Rotaria sordida]
TTEKQNDFKNKLITYYKCDSSNMKKIKYMILNKYFGHGLIRVSYIWTAVTKGAALTEFKLYEYDVNNE